jgi:uncharacterized membrane protein (DUF4010 family)
MISRQLRRHYRFAALFLLIQVASTLGERHLGKFGFPGLAYSGGW